MQTVEAVIEDKREHMRERLLQVSTPRYVAGAVWSKRAGVWVCVESAPILSWMRRKSAAEVADILKRYGYRWEWVT